MTAAMSASKAPNPHGAPAEMLTVGQKAVCDGAEPLPGVSVRVWTDIKQGGGL